MDFNKIIYVTILLLFFSIGNICDVVGECNKYEIKMEMENGTFTETTNNLLAVSLEYESGEKKYFTCLVKCKQTDKMCYAMLAAHVIDSDVTDIRLVYKIENGKNVGVPIDLETDVIFHPEYDPDTHIGDIVLLKITKDYSNITLSIKSSSPFNFCPTLYELYPNSTVSYSFVSRKLSLQKEVYDSCSNVKTSLDSFEMVKYIPTDFYVNGKETKNQKQEKNSKKRETKYEHLFFNITPAEGVLAETGFLLCDNCIAGLYGFNNTEDKCLQYTHLYYYSPWITYIFDRKEPNKTKHGLRFHKWTKKPITLSTKTGPTFATEREKSEMYYEDINAYRDVQFVKNPCSHASTIFFLEFKVNMSTFLLVIFMCLFIYLIF
ncbi:uncharacterized protein LOC126897586 [Daktulosphaira vitifoliae]|uniref:uncharacterized protein LOC126897586 n=1 Tax=Daktulosphaira vitifoliae TaxID=58002 RepID=UPI0021A9A2D5|nr:uncharacterized protein LOC126897586 [Daktulosphaira vitifoliae]